MASTAKEVRSSLVTSTQKCFVYFRRIADSRKRTTKQRIPLPNCHRIPLPQNRKFPSTVKMFYFGNKITWWSLMLSGTLRSSFIYFRHFVMMDYCFQRIPAIKKGDHQKVRIKFELEPEIQIRNIRLTKRQQQSISLLRVGFQQCDLENLPPTRISSSGHKREQHSFDRCTANVHWDKCILRQNNFHPNVPTINCFFGYSTQKALRDALQN